jgi:hypothetical protein
MDAKEIIRRSKVTFLERELGYMRFDAEDTERALKENPSDCSAKDRLIAIYRSAAETWSILTLLRSCNPDRFFDAQTRDKSIIVFDS